MGVSKAPEQTFCETVLAEAVGDGLTPMIKVFDGLVQEGIVLLTAVTVIAAIAGLLPVLLAVKEAIFPEPLAASPTDVLLLVQL